MFRHCKLISGLVLVCFDVVAGVPLVLAWPDIHPSQPASQYHQHHHHHRSMYERADNKHRNTTCSTQPTEQTEPNETRRPDQTDRPSPNSDLSESVLASSSSPVSLVCVSPSVALSLSPPPSKTLSTTCDDKTPENTHKTRAKTLPRKILLLLVGKVVARKFSTCGLYVLPSPPRGRRQ